MTPPPCSVLVVCTRRIGDVLLTTPLVRSLKRAWPQAAIEMLVFRGTDGILAGNPDLARIRTIAERPSRVEHLRFAASIARRFDLAVSALPGDRPTLYAAVAGRRRVGLVVDTAGQTWKRRVLDIAVPFDNDHTHTVAMNLALADALGVPRVPEVVATWTDADAQAVDALCAQHGLVERAYAALHPSPKFRYKQWTDAGWSALAQHLVARGLKVALTGSPDPDERALVARVASAAGQGVVDLSGVLSLSRTTRLIAGAALYVGPDTVTTHAAAATGVPTVALFGPSDPVKWGPWPAGWSTRESPWSRVGSNVRGNVALVQGEVHDGRQCVPCRFEGCERHVGSASDCLTGLTVERVIAAVEAARASRTSSR